MSVQGLAACSASPAVPSVVRLRRGVDRRLLPLATTGTAVLLAATLALTPDFGGFPLAWPEGWQALPVIYFLLLYVAGRGLAATAGLAATCLHGSRALPAAPPGVARAARAAPAGTTRATTATTTAGSCVDKERAPRGGRLLAVQRRRWDVLAAGLLAALVLAEGLTHLGPHSGSWASSRPRKELDAVPADGFVFWLNGQPVQSDSSTFVLATNVFLGRQSGGAIDEYARSGRSTYPFLAALLARPLAPLGGLYGAFVAVNLLCWWAATLAVYALAGRAGGGHPTQLAAGALVATGIGFTFMAGNAMSYAAAYGALPVTLWLLDRLDVFRTAGRWADLALTAPLAAAAGLLNSLIPLYLLVVALREAGRSEWRRLAFWAVAVLAAGQAWSVVLNSAGSSATQLAAGGDVRSLVALLLAGGALLALGRLPAGWGERCVAGAALAAGVAAALLLGAALRAGASPVAAAVSALHLPAYLAYRDLSGRLPASLPAAVTLLRQTDYAANLLAAFPATLLPLALLGAARLSRPTLAWALAVAASAGLLSLGMIFLIGEPHARLAYLAFPAVYLAAARGAWSLGEGAAWIALRRWAGAPPWMRPALAGGVALLALAPVAVASNASLWGNMAYDLRFHFVSLL